MTAISLTFDVFPYRLSGLVVGALLNHAPAIAALGAAVHQPPYKAPPQAPVLAIKPRNTLALSGADIEVPAGVAALEIGASLGIVIGRTACRVPQAAALDVVAGYTIVNDVSVPVPSHYRPSVRFRARDGFCPIGPRVVPAADVAAPDALGVQVQVDGVVVHESSTAARHTRRRVVDRRRHRIHDAAAGRRAAARRGARRAAGARGPGTGDHDRWPGHVA